MGQAKTNMELKREKRRDRAALQEYTKTIPERIFKGIAGAILFIPMTFFAFGCECFRQNKWPWELR